MNIAYVQKHKGEYGNINFLNAARGFNHYGYDVVNFDEKDIKNIPINKDTPCFAGIRPMEEIFDKIGIENPLLPYYPEELIPYMNRKVEIQKFRQVQHRVTNLGEKVFAKPLETYKKWFTGRVFSEFKDFIFTASFPGEMEVWTSEVVDFISEYRVFVNEGEVLDIRHYKGSWRHFPNPSTIQRMIDDYNLAPISYSLDVGVTSDGTTLLVEVNDSMSLGCYGIDYIFFGKMLLDRWKEITK